MFQFSFSHRCSHWIRPAKITPFLASAKITPFLVFSLLGLQCLAPSAQAMTQRSAIKMAMLNAVPLPRPLGHQLENGIHVFGETSERDQLGSTYMIFEVKDAEVLGAVYAPHSSYSCFEGRFNNNQLAIRVDDPYGDDVFLHEIALEQTAVIAASKNLESVDMQVGLAGMKPLNSIKAQEQSLLASCQANLS